MAEVKKEKSRAPRNRTLSLSDADRSRLRKRLLLADRPEYFADEIINRTLLGDSLSVLPHLPSDFADLVIVDPPYNLFKNFNGSRFSQMSDADYELYLESWMGELSRILKADGSLYVCGDWKCSEAIYRSVSRRFTVLNRITWGREKGRAASRNWKNSMEDIWFAVKNPKDYFFDVDAVKLRRRVMAPYRKDGSPKDWEETESGNFRDTAPSNFWDDISIPFWSMPENTDHPTQKPEKLIAKLVLASSKKGDIVLDPFLGSGTTSVVAKKLGRRYVGIEREEEYACIAERRLELADEEPGIQGFSDGVFWERNSTREQKCKR